MKYYIIKRVSIFRVGVGLLLITHQPHAPKIVTQNFSKKTKHEGSCEHPVFFLMSGDRNEHMLVTIVIKSSCEMSLSPSIIQ